MKIGIFGGSFNPPHKKHKEIAQELIRKHYVDKIIFVPTGAKYKYKYNLLSNEERLTMLELMIEKEPNMEVSTYELQDKVVYTYQTLDHFTQKYPHDDIYFICGTDNLSYIDKWKHGKELLKKYKFLVIKRNMNQIEPLLKKYKDYKDHIIVTTIKESTISSTKIREKVYNKKGCQKYLDKRVLDYIKENSLYRKEEENEF
ncbi:MAG TPA: nicotinate (nicotinamide) nucleotide adenylyltransferase [Candidatus Onthousia faecigallinarum]|nr:nicotinate (nicotinamide) nucleotide adenylyltransferase [Candidatus Onthousia faecigallinarum]